MKRWFMGTLLALLLVTAGEAGACVGKILYIGIPNAPAEQVLAELVATLVSERTGTTVKVLSFKDSRELYAAVKKGNVGLVIENRDRGFDVLGKPRESNPKTALETLRREYQRTLNMVWLEPFGGDPPYAPVITTETLSSLPALPKLLNKLAGMLTDDVCARLVKAARGDDRTKKVARDFLKSKRLI